MAKINILEALQRLRNDLKLWVANNLRVKLDKNLGEENKNKVLVVSETGDVVPTEINFSGGESGTIIELITWEEDD